MSLSGRLDLTRKTILSKSSTLTKRVIRTDYSNVLFLRKERGKMYVFDRENESNLAFPGSNQAREGRLVNALAARGDERRDTLR